jgi:hypothetical protein
VIAEMIAAGKFPKPIKVNDAGRILGWLETEIAAWQEARIALRDAGASPVPEYRPVPPRPELMKKNSPKRAAFMDAPNDTGTAMIMDRDEPSLAFKNKLKDTPTWPERKRRWAKTYGKLAAPIELRALEIFQPDDVETCRQSFICIVNQVKEIWESGELKHTPAERRDLFRNAEKAFGAPARASRQLPSADRLRLLADHPVLLNHLSEVGERATTLAAQVQVRHSGGKPNRIANLAAHHAYGLMLEARQTPITTPNGPYVS